MQFRSILVHIFLFGCILVLIKCQEAENGQNGENGQTAGAEEEEDEDDDSALAQLNNVTGVEDFISLLQTADGSPVSMSDLFSEYESQNGKLHITAGGGRFPEPDDCSPRDTTVRLPLDTSDPNVLYYPTCTKIRRCGGCCRSANLECVPAYTERESLQVLKAEVRDPRNSHLEYTGWATVIVDVHVTCRLQCNLTPEKCGPKKKFEPHQCDCKCREYRRCQPPHVWDPEQCTCACAERIDCCKDRGSPCGLSFNSATCECDVSSGRQHISNVNITEEQIQQYLASLNSSDDSEGPQQGSESEAEPETPRPTTPSTTTSTTTTTTTTTTTEPDDPCQAVNCPRSFTKQLTANGMCVCRPNMRFTRYRYGAGR